MIVSSTLKIKRGELSRRQWNVLFRKLTFVDTKQNVYQPWRVSPSGTITIPRGAWNLLPDDIDYDDRRTHPKFPKHDFKIELDATLPDGRTFERQQEAVDSMFENEQGLILRPPGTGKTQIALAFVAQCGTNSLVLVNTKDILDQWLKYAAEAMPSIGIGIIGDQQYSVGQLTIATVQSFSKLIATDPKEWEGKFGCVIQDEAHHAPAATFDVILNRMKAFYRFGFTASATRADGKHPYMKSVIGPTIHRLPFSSPIPVTVVPVKTDFYYAYQGAFDWHKLIDALTLDKDRNKAIADIADQEISDGNSILILSRRVEHLYSIWELMEHKDEAQVLTGELKRDNRKELVKHFRSGALSCVLATQLADEGLDIPRLNRVALTHPGRHGGRLVQQVGRALRESPGKTEAIVYDVYDPRVRVLKRQWQARKKAYSLMKLKVKRTRRV